MIKVNFPKSGMGIDEGTIIQWRKSDGDCVVKGEVIVEIETAKAIQEVLAPVTGKLKILADAGATVPVNTALGAIEADE